MAFGPLIIMVNSLAFANWFASKFEAAAAWNRLQASRARLADEIAKQARE
jgi:hypothetical protein